MAATFFGNRTPSGREYLEWEQPPPPTKLMMEIFSDVPPLAVAASAAETELLKGGGGKARVETSLECGLPFSH